MLKTKHLLLILPFLLSGSLFSDYASLDRLMKGNMRYVHDKLEHPNRSSEWRQTVVTKQEPFAIILSCSDSRVPPEILFDQGIGDLFVVRVAGNVAGPIELDSIDYAALHLHSSLIMVLGHENCGAVKAVIDGDTQDIKAVAKLIEPAVKEAEAKSSKNILEDAVKTNVQLVVQHLKENKDLAPLLKEDKLKIVGGYYHLGSGTVELLP